MIYPAWIGPRGGGSGERYPAYVSTVDFANPVAQIGTVNKSGVTMPATIANIVSLPSVRFPAAIGNIDMDAISYPSAISSVSHTIRGVAGISNIST